jgi:hypothetical protein
MDEKSKRSLFKCSALVKHRTWLCIYSVSICIPGPTCHSHLKSPSKPLFKCIGNHINVAFRTSTDRVLTCVEDDSPSVPLTKDWSAVAKVKGDSVWFVFQVFL